MSRNPCRSDPLGARRRRSVPGWHFDDCSEPPRHRQDSLIIRRARRVPKRRRGHSGRHSRVEFEQPTERLPPFDPDVCVRRARRALDRHVPESLMVTLRVVVAQVLRNRAPNVRLTHRHDPIERLRANRRHEPFRVRIQIRAARRQPDHLHPPRRNMDRNSFVYRGSRSRIRYLFPCKKPSPASSRFRATCSIHRPSGQRDMPAISTRRVARSITKRTW